MQINSISNTNFEARKILKIEPRILNQENTLKYPFAKPVENALTTEVVKVNKKDDLDFIIRYYKSLLNIISNYKNQSEKRYIKSLANFLKDIISNSLNPTKNFYISTMKEIGILSGFIIDTQNSDKPIQNSKFKIAINNDAINSISDIATQMATFNELSKHNIEKNLEMIDSVDHKKYYYPNIKTSKEFTENNWHDIMNIKDINNKVYLDEYIASLND